MPGSTSRIEVYLEVGKNRAFAGAIDWPGWCRSGRDEADALASLFGYGDRYALALRGSRLGFRVPKEASSLEVVERLRGTSTTEFGAPDVSPSRDGRPVDDEELERFRALLRASWRAFDQAVSSARGKTLRRGPRGGGRTLGEIVQHVAGAEQAYLGRIGWRTMNAGGGSLPKTELTRPRQAILQALSAAVRGELPSKGPRGGRLWSPRYFVRRVSWHALDHAWEIEDRVGKNIWPKR